MERIKKPRRSSRLAFLSPAARGWRLRVGAESGAARVFPTLAEAAAAIPPEHALHLALPASAVLLERMQLPATDRAELAGMMRLQLEKTLPFPAEEITSDLAVLKQTETESLILALAVHDEQLNLFAQPLRERRVLPEKMTFFALQVAAEGDPADTECVIYAEDGKVVLVIGEGGKLCYAQTVSSMDAGEFFTELPQMLLSTELDGVPASYSRVRLDRELASWEEQTNEFFGVRVDLVAIGLRWREPQVNLVPASWQRDRAQLASAAQWRGRLLLAGIAYLVLLLLAAGAIFWMKMRLDKIEAEVRATQPQIDLIAAEKARWTALMPAIDPSRYPVEILRQVFNSLATDDIRLTKFTSLPAQFSIEAEAPTASLAVNFGERLKKNPGLSDFNFEIGPPAILPNEHAQLQAVGKL